MITVLIAADVFEEFAHLQSSYRQEWESRQSIEYMVETLHKSGFLCEILTSPSQLLEKMNHVPRHLRKNFVIMNLIEGFFSRNREGYIPALAEMAGFPHTGSDAAAQIVTLDKYMTGLLAKEKGLPVKYKKVIKTKNDFERIQEFPVFIKPRIEGSGSGIGEWSIVHTEEDLIRCYAILEQYTELVAEEYLEGAEYTVAVIGNGSDLRASSAARVQFEGNVYGEDIKAKDNMPETLIFDTAVKLNRFLMDESIRICAEIGIAGYARVDWKTDLYGNPFLLELNLTPGLSYFYSSFPKCYMYSFGNYQKMLEEIIYLAMEEYEHKRFMYGKL